MTNHTLGLASRCGAQQPVQPGELYERQTRHAAVPFDWLDSNASIAAAIARRMTDLQRHTVDASKWLPTRQQAVAFGLDGTLLWLIEGTRRGVAAIVVLGHDRFDGVRVERTLEAAQEAISMRLQLERQACVTSKTVDHHVEHLAAAALGNTGVIDTQRCFRNAVNPATGRAADSVAV